jgi:hypothetical protein
MENNWSYSREQTAGAKTLIRHGLNLRANESLLILHQSDEEYTKAAECIKNAAKSDDVLVRARTFSRQQFSSRFPVSLSPDTIKEIPQNAIILLMEWSASTTFGRLSLLRELRDAYPEWRIASMPGVGIEQLAFCDYDIPDVRKRCESVFAVLARADVAELSTENPKGETDNLIIPLSDHLPTCSTGRLAKGTWGNFPSGETFVLPKAKGANGWVTVRGSLPTYPLPSGAWVRFEVRRGKIRFKSLQASSVDLGEFITRLFFYPSGCVRGKNANSLAELGIGTNPAIGALTGNPVFDEKKIDTVHLGFGGNHQFNGPLISPVHYDVVCRNATLKIPNLVGSTMIVNSKGFCLTQKEATPLLGSFPALDKNVKLVRRCIATPTVHCDSDQLLIEYHSERGTTRFRIGTDECSSITKKILAAIDQSTTIRSDKLIRTMEQSGVPTEFCNRILCGLIEYKILQKVR